jgi:hypothetical protein
MKKLSLLLSTLGGAMAGYVFSNKKLREQLSNAKDPTAAAKILGKHLSHDGQMVAKEVAQLAEHHGLDDRVADGKKYVQTYYKNAKGEVEKFLGTKARQVKNAAKTSAATVKKNVMKTVKKVTR